jgi:hypothetical protein
LPPVLSLIKNGGWVRVWINCLDERESTANKMMTTDDIMAFAVTFLSLLVGYIVYRRTVQAEEAKLADKKKTIAIVDDTTTCANCGASESSSTPLKACGQCQVTFYCSKECQLKHWKSGHKQTCSSNKVATLNSQNGGGGGVRAEVVELGLELKGLVTPTGLSQPKLPGWPLRTQWPVSPDKLKCVGLSRYTYRYPGYHPMISDKNLPKSSPIRKWNELVVTSESMKWANSKTPLEHIRIVEPFVECNSPIPNAIDALQYLYLLAAQQWKDDGEQQGENMMKEPDAIHRAYFDKAVTLMKLWAHTDELQCEYPLANLLLKGNVDFNFEKDETEALSLLHTCCTRGGAGDAALTLAQYYRKLESNSLSGLVTVAYYMRLAAEQEQMIVACSFLAQLCEQVVDLGIDATDIAKWKEFSSGNNCSSSSSTVNQTLKCSDIPDDEFSVMVSRSKDETRWTRREIGTKQKK